MRQTARIPDAAVILAEKIATMIGVFRNGFWILDYNGNGTYDGVGAGGDKFYGFGGNAGEIPVVAD